MTSLVWLKLRDFIAIGHYMGIGLYGGEVFGLSLFLWLMYKHYYLLTIPYTLWYIYDFTTPQNGSRPTQFVRDFFPWRAVQSYFPMRLHKTADLPPDKNYFFICHPHGLLAYATFTSFATNVTGFNKLFPGIFSLMAGFKFLFWIPIFREYLIRSNVVAADTKGIMHYFTKNGNGNSVALVVGGTRELLEAKPGSTTLVLKNRKGFCKIALRTGASLVPVFSFGENELYNQLHHQPGFQWLKTFWTKAVSKIGFSLVLPTSFYPRRIALNTVVGAPIAVRQIEYPQKEDIDSLHEEYMNALVHLFEEHKLQYGMQKEQRLIFI